MSFTASDYPEQILIEGIRNYMKQNGFRQLHLGLSGGIDSALVAYLAVEAAGAEHTTALYMPSRFSSQSSADDAQKLAKNLGCRYEILPIEPVYRAFLSVLEPVFNNKPFDITEENLQSRIRGTLLMAYANKFNSMLLNASNKSEAAMGYCTLYGDASGVLGPIGDLFKTEVFALCNVINDKQKIAGKNEIIPRSIIDKAPSAELRPNQKDEDTLPPYPVLDEILKLHLVDKLSAEEIAARGFDRELTGHIIQTVKQMAFKWRQMPPVLKIIRHNTGQYSCEVRYLYEQ